MLLARPSLAAMKRKQPRGFATLTWVLPDAGLRMDPDARQAASEVTKEFDSVIRAQAAIIEGGEFRSATVRAIIAGLDAMSRSSGAKKVFSEVAPAVAWCAERHPEGTPVAAVPGVVRALGESRDALVPRGA